MVCRRKTFPALLLVSVFLFMVLPACTNQKETIGVLYVLHGGMDTNKPMYMWDASVQMFSYDPNHAVYKFVIKDPKMWPAVLNPETTEFAVRFLRKYEFTYDRIGGVDPFRRCLRSNLRT